MLEADNLECVRGERRLFAGLGFRLEAGELLYLQGKNGSGKTSLLRMLIGLLPPEAGEIRWKGQSIKSDDFRADLCYLGHLNAIKEELTPLENLLAAAHLADEELSEDDALDALECDQARIRINNPLAPAIVEPDDAGGSFGVVMPMRID